MPVPTRSLSEIASTSLSSWRGSFPGYPVGPTRFLGRSARAMAIPIWGLHGDVEKLASDVVPSANSSDDVLSAWAARLGLPDGAGGFGRRVKIAASGGTANVTGIKNTSYGVGITAVADDGTVVRLTNAPTIAGMPPGYGSAVGNFAAVTTGLVGNLPVGARLSWTSPPGGADPTFTLTGALSGGLDAESNDVLFGRISERLQNPPAGSRAIDFKTWASTARDSAGDAAFGVYVYPLRHGSGTVDVVVVVGGSGSARASVPSALLAAISDYVASMRTVTVELSGVSAPQIISGHVGRVRLVASPKHPFDWVDTGGSYTVSTYVAGPPSTIKLNTLAPVTLKSAITAFTLGTGLAPRLQVISTGSVVNAPIHAVAYSDAAGQTTLTLETLPTGWVAPTAGDVVYAYGDAVPTVAANLVALADALGPSRTSGYGDRDLTWPDTLTISSMVAVAENAIASDGGRLVQEVLVDGATIDGAEVDVRGIDPIIDPPELLYWSHVAVTQ